MAQGFRPDPKLIAVDPFYPFGQADLFASMRSYQSTLQTPNDSATKAKILPGFLSIGGQTMDIVSPVLTLTESNPSQGPWLNPLVARRETQNAGNLPNPTGLDNENLGRF